MKYTLRQATAEDYDYLYQLHLIAVRAAVEALWGWDENFQADYFRMHWDVSQRHIVLLKDVQVGTITLDYRPTSIFVRLLEIHPDYQGQGIGTALLHDLINDAGSRNHTVELQVLKTNPKAQKLYERLGFVTTQELENRYTMVWSERQ